MFGPPLTKDVDGLRDAYLESASRAEGTNDFGSRDFIEPLDIMLGDLVRRAHLTAFGHLLARYYLKQILRMRLKIQRAAPASESIVQRPIFILGLPRTGTTLLHELLSQHEDLRAPTFHESHHYPNHNWREPFAKALTHAQLFVVDRLAPAFKRIHELRAYGPHECVSIQGYALRSMQFHVAFRLPLYNQWMMSNFDWGPAYRMHSRYLSQLSQSGERWVLKAPGHMLGLDALIEQYPDALFIQTHRNPLEVIPSMASLTLSLRRMASRDLNPREIGHDVNKLWHKGITTVLEKRKTDPAVDAKFIDIHYQELINDPANTLERIARFVKLDWQEPNTQSVQTYLDANPRQRHGKHTYDLEQFDLEADTLTGMYEEYQLAYLQR
ncbi:MAG: hypothetical protein GKR90_24455 [Pseudomonadales bacterium]|nr:hypothetical protein [Pseudomonadales bacterium]